MDARDPNVVRAFVDAMFQELQIVFNIQSSLDGDMHQYIKYIVLHHPDRTLTRTQRTYKLVLHTFLERCPRYSTPYRKVFAKFYASRHSNDSDDAMYDFVSEVELQIKPQLKFIEMQMERRMNRPAQTPAQTPDQT